MDFSIVGFTRISLRSASWSNVISLLNSLPALKPLRDISLEPVGIKEVFNWRLIELRDQIAIINCRGLVCTHPIVY